MYDVKHIIEQLNRVARDPGQLTLNGIQSVHSAALVLIMAQQAELSTKLDTLMDLVTSSETNLERALGEIKALAQPIYVVDPKEEVVWKDAEGKDLSPGPMTLVSSTDKPVERVEVVELKLSDSKPDGFFGPP